MPYVYMHMYICARCWKYDKFAEPIGVLDPQLQFSIPPPFPSGSMDLVSIGGAWTPRTWLHRHWVNVPRSPFGPPVVSFGLRQGSFEDLRGLFFASSGAS